MTTTLRFVFDEPRSAAFNMAADQFLLQTCQEQNCVTVRFYCWQPAAITIGYMQQANEQLDLALLEREGISWIRRPTGGRAVLHQDDLTYSCIFPRETPAMGSTVAQSYALIMRCLTAGLAALGLNCSAQDSVSSLIAAPRTVKLPCFLAPNRDEIMVAGKKLLGSAQKRTRLGTLQHGSLPRSIAYRQLPRFLRQSPVEQQMQITALAEKSISLAELVPDISLSTLEHALAEGFKAHLPFPCKGAQSWSVDEIGAIAAIATSSTFVQQWLTATAPPRQTASNW